MIMSWKKIGDEAAVLFAKPAASDYLQGRLEELRSNIKDGQQLRRKLLLLMLLLAALFELVVRRAVVEFSLGFMKVSDASLVMKLLPVIFAFVFVYITASFATTGMMRALHSEILAHNQPDVSENPVKELLLPPSVFSILSLLHEFRTGEVRITPLSIFVLTISVSVLILPPLVLAYMFWRCFAAFGAADWLLWISLVLSLMMVLAAFEILAVYIKVDPKEKFSL
jgi:hypothetical protein